MDFRSTERFSDRVEAYVKYRPHYPSAVFDYFRDELGLSRDWVVADIGSGTGILAKPFLDLGNIVYGVEPNADMRAAAERILAGYPNFRSMGGTAEETGLPDRAIDFVVAGQAFHWFDAAKARGEFLRFLKPGAYSAVLWNNRLTDGSPFLVAYEEFLLEWGTDYAEVSDRYDDSTALDALYGTGNYTRRVFANAQRFDFEGLRGRLCSSSYVPTEDSDAFGPMMDSLRTLYDAHEAEGRVEVAYDTIVYAGRPGA